MLRYLTSGETHGKALIAILEGVPSNLKVDIDFINQKLALRQSGYGRGDRMKIEKDKVDILSGVRDGKTLGSPIALQIVNRDWENWQQEMAVVAATYNRKVTRPRPGHADLSGVLKYNHKDIRNVLERASARETAIRTAIGELCSYFMTQFGINTFSHVVQIGTAKQDKGYNEFNNIQEIINNSKLRCLDGKVEENMIELIRNCKEDGDSIGGKFQVVVQNVPVGLGSYVHWDRKLDANISYSLMGVQAIKAVEFGAGIAYAEIPGSQMHDQIEYVGENFRRKTNNAGGIEGGMTNGEDVVVTATMKPIPTLYKPLKSVDIETKEVFEASIERSDVCAVTAASVVGEAVVMFEIAKAFFEKFGGDSYEEISNNYINYKSQIGEL